MNNIRGQHFCYMDNSQTQHERLMFRMQVEKQQILPLLDVLVVKKQDGTLGYIVYRKLLRTNRYLHADSIILFKSIRQ